MLAMLGDAAAWQEYLEQRRSGGHMNEQEAETLSRFVQARAYEPVARAILAGEPLPPPRASEIVKKRTGKRRTVFVFPPDISNAMKLLAWGLHRYEGAFCRNLYSFRRGVGARHALARLLSVRGLRDMYVYKADIHDYFNSVDVEKLLPMLEKLLADDAPLTAFLAGLLCNPLAVRNGEPVKMRKGIMAGMPISPFLANVYLMDLDWSFERRGVVYARYSDDILVLAETPEARAAAEAEIRGTLAAKGLEINPDKESRSDPGEPWTFLGFTYADGKLDVARVSVEKIKGKMRRKARALLRWRRRKGKDGGKAARAFIRRMNRKLFENPVHNELTWARWYFPVITTDRSLRELDRYMQDCIRYIVAGNHGKKRFNLRYDTMKQWGYRSLVHEWYLRRDGD